MNIPFETALAVMDEIVFLWRERAVGLESRDAKLPADHIRVCANELRRVVRALRAEFDRSAAPAEHAGGPPPSPLSVTGRASSADDARPSSMP